MRYFAPLLLATLATLAQACTTFRDRPIAPQQFQGEARVTLDDRTFYVQRPTISGDSLFGERYEHRIAIPLSAIRRLEARVRDDGLTALAIAGTGAAIVAAVVFWIEVSSWDFGPH